jgi:hypothetical protein
MVYFQSQLALAVLAVLVDFLLIVVIQAQMAVLPQLILYLPQEHLRVAMVVHLSLVRAAVVAVQAVAVVDKAVTLQLLEL